MAGYSMFIAVLAFCMLPQASSQVAKSVLTITPGSLTLSPTQADSTGASVTVVCKPPSSAGLLYALRINRKVGNTNTPLALVTTDPPNPQDATYDGTARLLLTSGGYSVSGGKLDRSITLVMARAKCSEAAEYICKVTSGSTGTTLNHEKKLNLTVDVEPNNITLTSSPEQSTWKINETLEIICNGIVGSVTDKTVIEWQWEYQQRSEFGDFPIQSWKPYSESSSYDPADIQIDSMVPGSSVPNSCYKRQTSRLIRRLQEEDNRREYRCYMIRDGKSYDSFAKILYVGTVTAEGTGGGGNNGGTDSRNDPPSKANVGVIIGSIIGGLILLAVIIVLVYFLVIRRRRNKETPETYDASPNQNKPGDSTGPPGYSSQPDPSVTYSAPNRFRGGDKDKPPRGGQTNKALDDEPDDKHTAPGQYQPKPSRYESKPARYENDFNQQAGRRNPSYDYENRGRHYSSDDGGSNMNTSMHSMGDGDPTIGTAI